MNRGALLQEIADFTPTDGNWLPFDELLGELWASGVTDECLASLFAVFERHPDDDGSGVLWGIVHGLEALDLEYESALRASMSRRPSLMARVMLDRLERARAL
jgi:hypothetical protein